MTLFAFALRANPEFHWVDIEPADDPSAPADPVRLGWIPNERLWRVDHAHPLQPQDEQANLPLSSVISSEEPPESVRRFTEFLRLPELSQQILASYKPDGHPGVVAVANAQDSCDSYARERIPGILEVHRDTGFSVMISCGAAAGSARMLFDFVFRLQGADATRDGWRDHELVCEKGIVEGPLCDMRPVRIGQIPLLDETLSRALSSS